MASASLMTESVKGKTRRRSANACSTTMHALLTQPGRARRSGALGKLAALSGVREFPARVKCASLCWHTLNAALHRRPSRLHRVHPTE